MQAAQTYKLIEDRSKHYMAIALAEIKYIKQEVKYDIGTVDKEYLNCRTRSTFSRMKLPTSEKNKAQATKKKMKNSNNR